MRFEYNSQHPRLSTQNSAVLAGRFCASSLSAFENPTRAITMGRYPWPEALLFEVLHIIIFYPTHQHTYRAVVLVAMIYLTAKIYLIPEITGSIGMIYALGVTISFHFVFTAYLLLAEGSFPDHWRRVRDEVHAKVGTRGLGKPPSSFSLTEKLWWTVDIAYSMRMIGWVQEPRNAMPPRPLPSRQTFLRKTFSKLIVNAIVADLSAFVFALSTTFDYSPRNPTDAPETFLTAILLLRRVPYTLSYGIGAGALISATYNTVALACVGLGRSSPTLWPDIWGRWGDAYTLRRLWGYVRRCVSRFFVE